MKWRAFHVAFYSWRHLRLGISRLLTSQDTKCPHFIIATTSCTVAVSRINDSVVLYCTVSIEVTSSYGQMLCWNEGLYFQHSFSIHDVSCVGSVGQCNLTVAHLSVYVLLTTVPVGHSSTSVLRETDTVRNQYNCRNSRRPKETVIFSFCSSSYLP